MCCFVYDLFFLLPSSFPMTIYFFNLLSDALLDFFCIPTYQICFSDKKVRRLESRRKFWKPVGRVVIQSQGLLKEMVFSFISAINLVGGEAIAPLSLQFRRPCVRELLLSKTLHGQKTFLCIVEEGKRNLLFFTLPFFSSQTWQDESRHIRMTYLFSIHDHGNIFDCFRHFDNFDRAEKGSPNLVKNHGLTSHVQIGPWVHANTYRGNGNNNVFQPRNWGTMGWNPFLYTFHETIIPKFRKITKAN